jgi:asparagine synthase (glutamine-hydrolysing)
MSAGESRFVISYNGEVYNHPELRAELESLGHRFQSKSDTEVVLHAWIEWGEQSLTRLNGMFAFALWDARERTLTLVRDKYGIKPLYYAMLGRTFVFGSEQRAILQHPAATRRIDKKALVEYLTFQNIISDRTLNEAIRILPAGHLLQLRSDSVTPTLREYWDFRFVEPVLRQSPRELEDELQAVIRQAVKRQMRSDVEVGSYLSGGLDSGTIAALAAQESSPLQTFTCGFDTSEVLPEEAHFDERSAARRMAEHLGSRHHETIVGPREFEAVLETVVTQLEEPRVGQSYPNYLVAKLASRHVKVVLSGAGGDELFGGYPWRYLSAFESNDTESFLNGYFTYWNRLFQPDELRQLLAPIWSEVADYDPKQVFEGIIRKHGEISVSQSSFLNTCLYFEAKTFLHGLFVVEDKLSMAHGLETRLPFMDDDVVNFAMRCPSSLKISTRAGGGAAKVPTDTAPVQGKEILRRVLGEIVGESFIGLRKQGFSAPDSRWFRNPDKSSVKDKLIQVECFEDWGLLPSAITEALGRAAGSSRLRLLTWSALSLQTLCSRQLT